MQIEQSRWTAERGWTPTIPARLGGTAQLVLVFGATEQYRNGDLLRELRRAYPEAQLFGCSTAGEICGTEVTDHSMVATAVHFERTPLRCAKTKLEGPDDSFAA